MESLSTNKNVKALYSKAFQLIANIISNINFASFFIIAA